MAPRFFVRSADDVIVASTEDDALVAPSGTTAVARSVITAAYDGPLYQGGTWDGTTYTPPSGQAPMDDTTTDIGRLRAAIRATHQQLFIWQALLAQEGVVHPATAVAIGHSFIAFAHQGMYLMSQNHRLPGNGDWSIDQRIAAAEAMTMGAADVTTPFEFFAAMADGGGLIEAPGAPVLWVNVDSGVRVNLAAAVDTTDTMSLDVAQLPAESILHGHWIDEVSA